MNQRQELFCLGIIEGKNAKQAYIDAGYAPKAAEVCASQLLRKPIIKNRIQELQKLTTSDRILTVVQIKEKLSDIIRTGEHKDVVKAADVLCKMLGSYAPTKSQSDSRIAVAAQISVVSAESKSSVERILSGERTERLDVVKPALLPVRTVMEQPLSVLAGVTNPDTLTRAPENECQVDITSHLVDITT